MVLIESQEKEIESLRKDNFSTKNGNIQSIFSKTLSALNKEPEKPISTNQLSAIMTIVSNSSVMFSTRDWSVTGTISAMTGALISTLGD